MEINKCYKSMNQLCYFVFLFICTLLFVFYNPPNAISQHFSDATVNTLTFYPSFHSQKFKHQQRIENSHICHQPNTRSINLPKFSLFLSV